MKQKHVYPVQIPRSCERLSFGVMMNDIPHFDAILVHADMHDLDRPLTLAICEVESNFSALAIRYEKHWKYHTLVNEYAIMNSISRDTEFIFQSCSWGMMQVMGTVAREFGFEGNLVSLSSLDAGLNYGCLKLKSLTNKYSSIEDAVSSYNQGSPRKNMLSEYKNKRYVDKVMIAYEKYFESFESGEW